jgi:hypothetical protein
VVANGVYGDRIGKMAVCQGINYEMLSFDDNEAVDVRIRIF